MQSQTERIAQRAARLLLEERFAGLQQAVHAAMETEPPGDIVPPGAGLVRRHLRALRDERDGPQGQVRHVQARLSAIEECLASLDWSIDDLTVRVAGAAAAGRFDEQTSVWFRVHCAVDDPGLCEVLDSIGFELDRIDSIETRFGRMTRIEATSDELDIVLLRCPHRDQVLEPANLVTGQPVSLLDAPGLTSMLADAVSDDDSV